MTLPAQQRRAASGFAAYCDTLFQLERFSEVHLEQLLRQINEDPRLEPGNAEMERFGVLKADLEARGQRLADADLIIAATALEHDLTLVTGNFNHFERIRGLKLESWIER